MKKTLLSLSFIFALGLGFSQDLIWSEDFENAAGTWTLNLEPTGSTNDPANSNLWEISDAEGGVLPSGCGTANNGNNTLFVTCQGQACDLLGASGAAYFAGDNGMGLGNATTDKRAILNTGVSTIGVTNLELKFDWIGMGEIGADYAVIEYSTDGGTTWTDTWTQVLGELCVTGQGQWQETSITLPAILNEQADLRFALRWRNDNNGIGTDPSFAVDNIRLFGNATPDPDPVGPVANFTPQNTSICIDDCIFFTDASTGTNITAWDWTFNGANTVSSTDQNPTNICYPTAGTYAVTLTVTDDNGTDTQTLQITVLDCNNPDPDPTDAPVAIFVADTNKICAGDCISFIDLSTGNPTFWEWTFQGGNPSVSNEQNPSKICFDEPGTYDITLTVANAYGTDQIISTIEVLELPEIIGTGDTLIEMTGTAVLTAEPVDNGFIFWAPEDEITCDGCVTVSVSPLVTTEYYPSIIGVNGCIGRDTITVSVIFDDVIDVPSAFSPNGDGMNDVLRVLGPGITELDFRIYNRYGQLVFQTDDQTEGWDGTFEGEPVNQGVFVYTITYQLVDQSSGKKSGNVTLIK